MTSSTASPVSDTAPSVFNYREQDGIVWGDYRGDTVTFGRFVGARTGDVLDVHFVHRLVANGAVATGASTSRIEVADGRLTLVENFELHGEQHVSVCIEV